MLRFVSMVCLILILQVGFISPVTQATRCSVGRERDPAYYFIFMDSFDYIISFRFADGIEILRICGLFTMKYAHPDALGEDNPQHRLTVTLGFHYGKTLLGRSLVKTMLVNSCRFLARWCSSLGDVHNQMMDDPMILISESIPDAYEETVTLVTDSNAKTRSVILFGGRLILDGLVIVLKEDIEINLAESMVNISMERNSVEETSTGQIHCDFNVSYAADSERIIVYLPGSAPSIHMVDLFLSVIITGVGLLVAIIMILKIRKRMTMKI